MFIVTETKEDKTSGVRNHEETGRGIAEKTASGLRWGVGSGGGGRWVGWGSVQVSQFLT